jgi:hypothetical protein
MENYDKQKIQLVTCDSYKLNIVFHLLTMVREFISALNWISVIVSFFYSHIFILTSPFY